MPEAAAPRGPDGGGALDAQHVAQIQSRQFQGGAEKSRLSLEVGEVMDGALHPIPFGVEYQFKATDFQVKGMSACRGSAAPTKTPERQSAQALLLPFVLILAQAVLQ